MLYSISGYNYSRTSAKMFLRIGFLFLIIHSTILRVEASIIAENNLNFDFYSQEHGLPNNQVHCILQDRNGWMWFGTSQGVCRFDGYKFTVFKNDPDDPNSLRGTLVRTMFEDENGELWIGTENGGLNRFNRSKENFQHFYADSGEAYLKNATVTAIYKDQKGTTWIGTSTSLYRRETDKLVKIVPANASGFSEYIRVIRSDKQGRIWLGTNNGLFIYDRLLNSVQKVYLQLASQSATEIWDIFQDKDGMFWIGTYSYGLFIVNPANLSLKQIIPDASNERSKTVRAITRDHNGKYWIGTRGGLYIYEKDKGFTGFYYHDEREPRSLVNNSIQCIYHDSRGDVWIGTRNGINFLIEERQNIKGYKALPGDNRHLNNGEVYAFWVDNKNNIWIGTESGGINILDQRTGTFRYLTHQKTNPNSLSGNCIKTIVPDGKGNLWIGTFLDGLNVLNLRTNKIERFLHDPANPAGLSDNRVWAVLADRDENIWVGTSAGLDKFDRVSGSFVHYHHLVNHQEVNWLIQDTSGTIWIGADDLFLYNPDNGEVVKFPETTRSMCRDSEGRYWLATQNRGLVLFDKNKGAVKYYSERNGLANNQTLAILEDNERFLWISTTNGLSKFDPKTERFQNYSIRNGFQNNQFTYGAAAKTPIGELIFGGITGFNIFNPARIKSGDYFPPIVFTDLKMFNKSVKIGEGPRDILTRSISETEEIVLAHNQNSITLDFASLDFSNSLGILYSFYLEGFEKDWNEPTVNHSATYTNLDPGEYSFRVKTVSIGRNESREGPVLRITVRPPIWKTWWFTVLLLMAIAGVIYGLIIFFINKEKLKNELMLERLNARKIHELNMMKLRFYTNISHEIRTPLTLILGPLEKLRKNIVPKDEIPGHLEVMHRNASVLHQLINQLLDFRKMESGNLKLNLTAGDMVSFLSGLTVAFTKLALEKGIDLKFNSLKRELVTNFDHDKLSKIVNNLLSNAIKFTGNGGKVSVNLALVFDPDEMSERRLIEITVKDTGVGIEEKNIDKIFTRFFQVDDGKNQTGTGIGLALTRELVKLHQGNITVQSKPGKGSKFTVLLPYENVPVTESVLAAEDSSKVKEVNKIAEEPAGEGAKIMLVIDDNADVRYYIRSHFMNNYQVLEAKNGVEGWELALKSVPDMIISDVMMPDMDGFEFCKKIKKDVRTSHIPVILLTALGSKEHELEGLSHGADDYIAKPFDISILQTKIENILSVRQSLRQKYSGELLLQPKNVILASPDERFLQKAIEVIELNIADPDFDIERYATEIGVSRMQLYRKLNALTEMTVKEFVKNIRLKRAAQLLKQKKLNISEIAFAVGFRDVSHFRKSFKQEFGMSATDYVEKHLES